LKDSGLRRVATVAGFNSVERLTPSHLYDGGRVPLNAQREHFADHWRALPRHLGVVRAAQLRKAVLDKLHHEAYVLCIASPLAGASIRVARRGRSARF
jgi:hypothetical protein